MMKPLISLMLLASSVPVSAADSTQVCNTNLIQSAPDSRFLVEIGSNGAEVLDTYTQLIWQRCSVGQTWNNSTQACTGTALAYTWSEALQQARALGGDYRLPNVRELASLRETRCSNPSLNIKFFPNSPATTSNPTSLPYWTSTPSAGSNDHAWAVDMLQVSTTSQAKDLRFYVRAVRAKPNTSTSE